MIIRNSRLILSIILIALLSLVLCVYFPWWMIGISAFAVCALIDQQPVRAFWSGFISIFLLWAFLTWYIDYSNQHILSQRVAQLLPLGGSSALLILLTSLVGALVGGLAALSGSLLRKLLKS